MVVLPGHRKNITLVDSAAEYLENFCCVFGTLVYTMDLMVADSTRYLSCSGSDMMERASWIAAFLSSISSILI